MPYSLVASRGRPTDWNSPLSEDQLRDAIAAFTRAERELTNLANQAEALRSASTRLSETETTLDDASSSLAGTAREVSSMAEALAALAGPLAGYVTNLREIDPKAILERLEDLRTGVDELPDTMADHANKLRNHVENLQTAQDGATARAIEATETIQDQLGALGAQVQALQAAHDRATAERRRLQLLLLVVVALSLVAASAAITSVVV